MPSRNHKVETVKRTHTYGQTTLFNTRGAKGRDDESEQINYIYIYIFG